MAPRLEACYFGQPRDIYSRMAACLEYSARKHCPTWEVNVRQIQPERMESRLHKESYRENTQKMAHWATVIEHAPDGAEILLIDADTLVTRDLSPLWEKPFDVAVTTKASKFPFNSGVTGIRVSDRTRAFVRGWLDENVAMLGDPVRHRQWQAKYGGINQAALGAMLEQKKLDELGITVARVPCLEWNCEDSNWRRYSPSATRVVHYKSALRKELQRHLGLGVNGYVGAEIKRLVTLWETVDRERQASRAITIDAVNRCTSLEELRALVGDAPTVFDVPLADALWSARQWKGWTSKDSGEVNG